MVKRPKDEFDDLEFEFPDDEYDTEDGWGKPKRRLTEEEIYELRRKKRRQMQQAQKNAAKKRERLFVLVFLAVFLTVSVGIFLIVRVVRNHPADPGTDRSGEDIAARTDTSDEPSGQETTAAPERREETATPDDPSEDPVTAPQTDDDYDPDAVVTDAPRQTDDPLNNTDENGNWVPPYPTDITIPSWITQDFIEIDEKTRPGRALTSVDNIVIHYVGNAGTSAKSNRDYFNDIRLHDDERGASAHFVVGLKGEVIQCVPLGEMAQANYPKNDYTISIETCHPDETGKFTETTYWALIRLTAWLCEEYGLTSDQVIRHYDVSGKLCPIYYCPNTYGDNPYSHEEAWEQLKADVKYYMWKFPDIANTDP